MKEQTWSEFLADCDVSHWKWTWGKEGDIIEANPMGDPAFCISAPQTVNWRSESVYITDRVGTGYIILALEEYSEGGLSLLLSPLDGRIFATEEEAGKYLKQSEVDCGKQGEKIAKEQEWCSYE